MTTYKDIKTYKDLLDFFKPNLVLCNKIIDVDANLYDNLENGNLYDEDENYIDIYQYYIIDNDFYETLKLFTNEIVFYSEILDCYIWGIDHFGTDWGYVNIDLKKDN